MHRPVSLALALLLLASFALAQRRCDPANLRVKVLYSNSRSARNHTQVDLLSASRTLVEQKFSDDTGNVEFLQIQPTAYHIRVTDPLVEENVSDQIELGCGETRAEMVTVSLKADAAAELKREESTQALVSALDLNVPGDAKKEFQRGADAMQGGDNAAAQAHFERAIALYPQYALAYNHLGVVYMQTGQPQKGREAFEKAVALNDHYPSALVNLAKLRFQVRNPVDAEALLQKAVTADPTNPEALALLCDAEIINRKFDEAFSNATRLHALPHKQFAAIHYLVAEALAAVKRPDDAIAQYGLFLQEAPGGKAADQARKEIARLKAQAPATQ